MAQETIDFGAYPNDPDSDAIRVAFQKTQNNFNELFSIQYQTGVSQLLPGAGISVDVSTGNVTVTNRIANITIQTDANLRIGVTTATSNTATINSGTTPFVLNLANSISTGNITATGSIRGVLNANSNAQPNITSVGNLANLSVVGTVRANSIVSNTLSAVSLTATYLGAPGSDQQVLFNSSGNVAGNPNLTFTGTALNVTGIVSATGNISGFNIATLGNISSTGNITANANINSNASISAGGNITATNFIGRLANGTSNISIPVTSGNINFSSAGNANVLVVTNIGANINGYANITGTASVGNLTATTVSAAGTITGGNLLTNGIVSATGSITGLNVIATSAISATGTIIGGNLVTGNIVSATGTITGGNFQTSGNVSAIGNIVASSNISVNGLLSAGGNIIAGNVNTNSVSATGNVQGSNIRATGVISAQGNLTSDNATLGNLATANFFQGNGSLLTGILATNVIGSIATTTTSLQSTIIQTNNANITNYMTFVNTTSGIANVTADSTLTYNPNTKVLSAGALSITGNIVAGNLNVQTGTLTGRNLSTGANTIQGNITGNWVLTTGSLLSATYADLAEYYAGDRSIEPGTVVEFGGIAEIRLCDTPMSTRVAGVVSTNPAYVMNSMINAEYPVQVALQGRVPVKVTGPISKGDMLVSAGNGLAKSESTPILGSILGKALQDFSGEEGIIEIAVGRL